MKGFINRLIGRVLYGDRYKKIYMMVRSCKSGDSHKAHVRLGIYSGKPYYCEGVVDG